MERVLDPVADNIKSVLRELVDQLDYEADLETTKKQCTDYLTERNITPSDKHTMLCQIKRCGSNENLFQYLYNSLLKYEGLGLTNKRVY